jgi:tetratricopeptide (TPR) repeat protein
MAPDPEHLLRRQEAEIHSADPVTLAQSLHESMVELNKELRDITDGAQPDREEFQKSLDRYLHALDERAKTPANGMATILWKTWVVGDEKNQRWISLSDDLSPLLQEAARNGLLSAASLAAADRILDAACADAVYDEYKDCISSSRAFSEIYQEAAQRVAGRNPDQGQLILSLSESARRRAAAMEQSEKLSSESQRQAGPTLETISDLNRKGEISEEYKLLYPLYQKDRANPLYAADLVECLVSLGRLKEGLELLPQALRLNRRRTPETVVLLTYQAVATDWDGHPKDAVGFAEQAATLARTRSEKPDWVFSGVVVALDRIPGVPRRVVDLIRALDRSEQSSDIARALDHYANSLGR